MAKEGGFFSPSRKTSGKNKQIASSMSGGSYGGYVDAGESRGFVSPEQADRMLKNPGAFKMRPSETRYLRDSMGLPRADAGKTFFSPSGNEIGQIASATTDLSDLIAASDFDKTDYDNFLEKDFGINSDSRTYQSFPNNIKSDLREQFKEKEGFKYKEDGQLLNKAPEKNILQKVGGFLANTFTGTQPVAAGTLDDKPTRFAAQVSPTGYEPAGPKLNYVNPDAKTMTMGQIGEAFKPSNLFGYKDKLGRYDDPGSPLDRQRQETMQNVYNKFTSPIVGDPRSIAQIRADQKATMQENARLRNEAFQNRDTGPASTIQKTFGADDTYGTGVPSNPAMGFSGKMSEEAKAKYAQSAKEATAGAQPDSSLGNVMTQTYNRIASKFGLPQKNLESVDDRQKRLAQKAFDKPRYQQEAYARRMLGITNDQLKARNLQQIRENAFARNQAFQADRAQRAVERAATRRGGNIGTGRDGGFGLGTTGQGMPSNPKGFSGYSRKSSPGTGTGTSSSRGGISRSTSRGQGGGASSRSKGGTSKGGSKAKSSGSRGQGGGSASRSKGGTGSGSTNTSRKASKASKSRTGRSRSQCDIRTKIDISSLTNQNLVKDDLATVAYFVQEIKEK